MFASSNLFISPYFCINIFFDFSFCIPLFIRDISDFNFNKSLFSKKVSNFGSKKDKIVAITTIKITISRVENAFFLKPRNFICNILNLFSKSSILLI